MLLRSLFLIGALVLSWTAQASLQSLTVNVISDDGHILTEYPVKDRQDVYRAYIEAQSGMQFGLRVHNRTGERLGVVIAVDGRNIISGQRSELGPDERMYVLEPYSQYTYRGWRTGQNQVNRFYFTDAGASYAAAWDDYSAMGVIALAVYPERRRPVMRQYQQPGLSIQGLSEPGTGFGQTEHSPSRNVVFRPEPQASGRWFIKYEWRDSLCQRGVMRCHPGSGQGQSSNRFWPDDDHSGGFAPRPPRRF